MVENIALLDCTLRDGGYVNDWEFGNGSITHIFDRLNSAGVDVIEIGFLDDRRKFDINRTIQPDTASLSKIYSKCESGKSLIFAMIDYGTCCLDNIQDKKETIIDGIRVIFKKENMHKATDYGQKIIEKGYKLSLQMVSITSYAEGDVEEFAEHVNKVYPYSVGIVDTYGLMHKEQVVHYYKLLDRYLKPEIKIGYHSHNNFQLAYSNTIELLKMKSDRTVIVDGTLYGMGKSAGNAPIELLSMYLNENYGKSYDINQLLEAIDISIMPIYQKHYWGYSLLFYIAAKNDCHPNFVKYLLDKGTLSIKDVGEILCMIPTEQKLKYNAEFIESLYLKYIVERMNDVEDVDSLINEFRSKTLLLIGPGKTSMDHEKISKCIRENGPVIIGINFMPVEEKVDFVFFSNPKRYGMLLPSIKDGGIKVIATSNITPVDAKFDYVLRYDSLIRDSGIIWDNALILFLNLVKQAGVKKIYLAGFDGFKDKVELNYVDSSFDLSKDYGYLTKLNEELTKKLNEIKKFIQLEFITESMYEEK